MTKTKRIPVTPLLEVGGGNDSLLTALLRIKSGHVANVATFDEARQVLERLGLREEIIEDRIHFALTGEILVAG